MTTAARALRYPARLLARRFASRAEWEHNSPSPPQFGTYALLSPKSALQVYPDPRPVPESIPRPAYVPANYFSAPIWEHLPGGEEVGDDGIKLGSGEEEGVRAAGRLAGEVLRAVGKIIEVSGRRAWVEMGGGRYLLSSVPCTAATQPSPASRSSERHCSHQPGMTTDDIDAVVHEMAVKHGAYPSPLGYSHFPRSCTTSVNNVIAREFTSPLRTDSRRHPGQVRPPEAAWSH
jgi:methionyl aminopeptidase